MQPEAASWRPQEFGRRRPMDLHDPLVEPAWDGIRVLVHVDRATTWIVDMDGTDLSADYPEVVAELAAVPLADALVVDGYLTDQAFRPADAIVFDSDSGMGLGAYFSQLFLGGRAAELASGAGRMPERRSPRSPARTAASETGDLTIVGFVAIDLLALDGEPLLDVPLLERKRLLESVLQEGDHVRRTPYVREPAAGFIATWRSLGFAGLAYKAANSRYLLGAPNDDWSIAAMPRR